MKLSRHRPSNKPFYLRKRFWLAGLYLLLLICSGFYRHSRPAPPPANDKKIALVQTIDGRTTRPEKIRLAYRETLPANPDGRLPVVLIHGSPGDGEVFDGLTRLLENRRVIAVDLPGFGDSDKNIPDYSVEAHALYLRELFDELKIARAHLVGFSMGGGVVLNFAATAPERTASVALVSAIGAQEYELFGDYRLNHAVHAAQLGGIYALQELTPHFGVFDGGMPYARNFYDTDQRPLRAILQKIDAPLLITHGIDDPLVPVEAAREHARLVPQSDYRELDDNHFYVFMRPAKIAGPLQSFWTSVENGSAKTRATADAARIGAAQQPYTPQIVRARGTTLLVFLLVFLLVVFLSEDLGFLLAGILAAQGWFGFGFAALACLFGVFAVCFVMLLLGRFGGAAILQNFLFRNLIGRRQVEDLSRRLQNERSRTVFSERPFFGFRLPVYFTAGWRRADLLRFWLGFSAAAVVWTGALTGFSFLAAKALISASLIDQQSFWALSATVFVLYLLARFFKKRVDRKR